MHDDPTPQQAAGHPTPVRPAGAAPEQAAGPTPEQLRERLAGTTLVDEHRLGRRLEALRRTRDRARRDQQLADLAAQVARAEQRLLARQAAVPVIGFPPQLPITTRRDDIAAAIRDHQVVVVAGETGSGKTTQLPKICLELGRGRRGMIGHTQPRRLAARTVAARIADELHTPVGGAVGYAVRFTDQVGPETLVKLMTDGILLAEIQRDRHLRAYDTLIVDEAHERSLNIDFLLGYLTRLLPRRPDLKVVVTSATIDPQRFSAHFGGAPVLEVSGRTYPVEIRYRPLAPDVPDDDTDDPDDPDHDAREPVRDQIEGITEAIGELFAHAPGDVLVFLSGEREIRDAADALADSFPDVEILPLYARLAAGDQHRVFAAHDRVRIVLATNVAETSLTVPGIRYVVDPGTARISRYSHRTKVQRLPIEPVSQASARQRSGRCGRTSDGIAIRLYSQADFESRPEFTEPEILRTNLAAVVLQLAALGLGDVAEFPFVQPPDRRSVRDALQLLTELGAVDASGELTPVGRRLAQVPLDPRLGRMVLAADENACVREVLVLVAALSIPDVRERPLEFRAQADQLHARFRDETSDFIGILTLWDYLRTQQAALSGNQFRRLCRAEYLNFLRIREWQDLIGQLRQVTRGMGIREAAEPAAPDRVHDALLTGLLSHVGHRADTARDQREFTGARGTKFVLAPGSTLSRRPPVWVVAAELVETSRLFGRVAARVDPAQVERAAGHLVSRSYSEPHWEARRGATMAYERVSLFGLPVVARRSVPYGAIDPGLSREFFIRHGLVEGDWRTPHAFRRANAALLDELAEIGVRARRTDLGVDDDRLVEFYDRHIPADVVSGRHFDAWWKKRRRTDPDLLTLTRADLVDEVPDLTDRPDRWRSQELDLPLTYRFAPGSPDDGITVHVPVDALAAVGPEQFAWQIPALRRELVEALLRGLPKPLRRGIVPVPDTARAVLTMIPDDAVGREPLLEALAGALLEYAGVRVPPDAWHPEQLPAHLRVGFVVEDAERRELARGQDLGALQAEFGASTRRALADATGAERRGLTDWPGGDLPSVVRSGAVAAYPALVDDGATVSVRVFAGAAEQAAAMRAGFRRLLRLTTASPVRAVASSVGPRDRLTLGGTPDGAVPDLLADAADAAVDAIVAARGGPAFDAAGFAAAQQQVRAELPDRVRALLPVLREVAQAWQQVRLALADEPPPAQRPAVLDVRDQVRGLMSAGWVARAGDRLPHLPRYLAAIERRLERLPREPDVDAVRMSRVHAVQDAYDRLREARPDDPVVQDVYWWIQELRVSLFAQALGTARPTSEPRILRAIAAAR